MKKSNDLVIARDRVIEKTIDARHPFSIEHSLSPCHPERERVEHSETSASRRTPVKRIPVDAASGNSQETKQFDFSITSDHQITRSFFSPCLCVSVVKICSAVAKTFNAALREIFDESAYDRFLQRTGASHSAESYRAFMRDRESTMAKKPRCC